MISPLELFVNNLYGTRMTRLPAARVNYIISKWNAFLNSLNHIEETLVDFVPPEKVLALNHTQ